MCEQEAEIAAHVMNNSVTLESRRFRSFGSMSSLDHQVYLANLVSPLKVDLGRNNLDCLEARTLLQSLT